MIVGIIESLAICEYWRNRSQDIDPSAEEKRVWNLAFATVAELADTEIERLKRSPSAKGVSLDDRLHQAEKDIADMIAKFDHKLSIINPLES